ncbi:MAG: methylated-DNA--[protein]-cysteine S-methyltransferase [Rhizomicrobium sp.]
MTEPTHRWGSFETRFGKFGAVVDKAGTLVRFRFHAERLPAYGTEDDGAIASVRAQVEDYCAGRRRVFDLAAAPPGGSDFERAVWQAMTEIPFGETVSYGAIARKLGDPAAARAVGVACNANPIPLIVPCHRVIGADGALVGFGGGLPLKRALLDFESVIAGRPRDLFATA